LKDFKGTLPFGTYAAGKVSSPALITPGSKTSGRRVSASPEASLHHLPNYEGETALIERFQIQNLTLVGRAGLEPAIP